MEFSLLYLQSLVNPYLVYFYNLLVYRILRAPQVQIINSKYLEVKFSIREHNYVYYAEIDRKMMRRSVDVLTPDDKQLPFYPGLIPRIKAKTIGLDYFKISENKEQKNVDSLENI